MGERNAVSMLSEIHDLHTWMCSFVETKQGIVKLIIGIVAADVYLSLYAIGCGQDYLDHREIILVDGGSHHFELFIARVRLHLKLINRVVVHRF